MIYNTTLNDHEKVYNSDAIYLVLLVSAFLIIIAISSAFIYFLGYLYKDNTHVKINVNAETVVY